MQYHLTTLKNGMRIASVEMPHMQSVSVGIWVFLASEVLFFGVLISTYAVYRSLDPEAFRAAAQHTEILYGTINTVLLLTSSVTMTVALRAATARLRTTTPKHWPLISTTR